MVNTVCTITTLLAKWQWRTWDLQHLNSYPSPTVLPRPNDRKVNEAMWCTWFRARASSPQHSNKSLHQTMKALQPSCLHFWNWLDLSFTLGRPCTYFFSGLFQWPFSVCRPLPAPSLPVNRSSALHLTDGYSLGKQSCLYKWSQAVFLTLLCLCLFMSFSLCHRGCGLWWVPERGRDLEAPRGKE